MSDSSHDSNTELLLGNSQLTADPDTAMAVGQTVVVCDGILKGVTGTLANILSRGRYLVDLNTPENIRASFPPHLLRLE